MVDVYIAYSHYDRTEATAMVIALQQWGYKTWSDAEILPGADWTSVMKRSVRQAKCVLALLSNSFLDSEYLEIYCQDAASRGILVPVLIQDHLDLDSASFIPRGTRFLDVREWRLTRDADKLASLISGVETRRPASSPVGGEPA
jgi:hypothetical protein